MKMNENFGWNRCVSVAALIAFLTIVGCNSGRETEPEAAPKQATIEAVEGMKYFVGGPVMKYDKYGRMRLGGFNGEISTPTTRGLLLGFKKNDDRTFDYRTWLNGEIISESSGFLDADDLLWYSERVSYDANGEVVVRQKFNYDDDKKLMISTLEHIDPVEHKVVKTETQEIPYTPAADEENEDDDKGADE